MMQLAYTAFLSGAALVLIPVILHLLKRKPSKPQDFPSLQFLHATVAKRQNRNSLWKLLVFIFRCLVIMAICFAFAWPFFSDVAPSIKSAQVILWDRSFSMQAAPWEEELKKAAQKQIEKTRRYAPTVIGVVGDSTKWSGRFCGDRKKLGKWFKKHCMGLSSSSFPLALKQAEIRLKNINCKDKKIVVITDKQALPWKKMDYSMMLAQGIKLEIITPSAKEFSNCAVTGIKNSSVYTNTRQALKVTAFIHNFSNKKQSGTVTGKIQGYAKAEKQFKLPPNGSTAVPLELNPDKMTQSMKDTPSLHGQVSIRCDDDLKADNTRYFCVNPSRAENIKIAPVSRGSVNFIATAILPGYTVADFRKIKFSEDTKEDFSKNTLLVLQHLNQFDEKIVDKIDNFLNNGGCVAMVCGNTPLTAKLLKKFGVSLNCCKKGETCLSQIDYDHMLFQPYTQVKSEGWFAVMFYKWLDMSVPPGARVIARFANNAPAITELNRGKGKVIIFSFDINRKYTDWPVNSTFLPFWRELLTYSKMFKSKQDRVESVNVSCAALPVGKETSILDSKGKLIAGQGAEFIPDSPGCYIMKKGKDSSFFCVNVPGNESNNAMLEVSFDSRIKKFTTNDQVKPQFRPKNEGEKIAAITHPDNKSWWWMLLAFAGICMICEMLVANRTAL